MAKNRSKYLEEASVESLVEQFNFFVPEIQREYVWGENYQQILDSFVQDLKESKNSFKKPSDLKKEIQLLTEQGKFQKIQELLNNSGESELMNIGFLYSYKPGYRLEGFPENDIYNDVYIIDGQQRLTTLFLTLFYHAIKEDRKNDFTQMFRYDKKLSTISFDYRVRNLTHDFLIELIDKVNSIEHFDSIEDSNWFLEEYASDPTIRAIVKAFKILSKHFSEDEDKYFDFLKTKIVFWHFKTDKTDQGEELYITMNSRGKQLEDNETIRAKLFEPLDSIEGLQWSEKWEIWQDFFWSYRDKNNEFASADEGFNEFLKCIAALEAYKMDSSDHFIEFDEKVYSSQILEFITLESINKHTNSLMTLFSNKEHFKSKYNYSGWVEPCFDYLYLLIFKSNTNWFVRYDDDKRAGEYRKMVFLWSMLSYLEGINNIDDNLDSIYRTLRTYWLRYNNHDRSVVRIKERVSKILQGGPWSLSISEDETAKHQFLVSKKNSSDIRNFEEAIWEIEDHPLNLNGYQVNLQNITHLVNFEKNPTVEELKEINKRFCSLLNPESDRKILSTILLYCGKFYRATTPYYYDNWDMSNWRRVIRDLDSPDKIFFKLFSEYHYEKLEELLRSKKEIFARNKKEIILSSVDSIPIDNLGETLCIYALVIPDIWKHGRYIADYVVLKEDDEYITEYERGRAIYNTKGDFRGYGNELLWEMAHEHDDSSLLDRVKEKTIELTN
jgi:uncharacterized protein with ParB-like and HNH nuclease domain